MAENLRQASTADEMLARLAPLQSGIERARQLTVQLLNLARVQAQPSGAALVDLPALARADPHLKVLARSVHEIGAVALIGVVALHALVALKHHFIDNDVTLRRMLPWRGDRF